MKEKLKNLVEQCENNGSTSRITALIADLSADVVEGQEIPDDILGVCPQELRQGIMIMVLGLMQATVNNR